MPYVATCLRAFASYMFPSFYVPYVPSSYLHALRFLHTFIFHVPYEPSFIPYLTCLRLFTCLICLQFFTCLRDFIFNITYMSPFFLCLTSFGLMFLHFLLALRPFICFCVLCTFSLYFWRALRAFTWNMKYETTQNQPRKAGICKSVVD